MLKPDTRRNAHKTRAALKGLGVGCLVGALVAIFVIFARARVVNGLINHLTLGLLVVMVVVINLVSLGLGLIAFLAYKWIKRDLEGGEGFDDAD
jgi:hypothetical protein